MAKATMNEGEYAVVARARALSLRAPAVKSLKIFWLTMFDLFLRRSRPSPPVKYQYAWFAGVGAGAQEGEWSMPTAPRSRACACASRSRTGG